MWADFHVMLSAGNRVDENCIDAITARKQIMPVLRRELSCCGMWEREGRGIDPLAQGCQLSSS